MTIREKMALTAADIKDRLVRCEPVSRDDLKFLQSYLNVHTHKAPNAGKRRNPYKKNITI